MLKRIAIPASAVVLLLAAAALAGCGGSGTVNTGTVPITSMPQRNQTTPAVINLRVFMVKGETVTEVLRTAQGDTDLVQQALADLLAGPNDAEKAQGISTAIPEGTRLLSYQVKADKASADFSKEMLSFGGGSARVQAILGQVDNTITANDPAVKRVTVTVEGKPAEEALQP
jgi:spore germination protein GerM